MDCLNPSLNLCCFSYPFPANAHRSPLHRPLVERESGARVPAESPASNFLEGYGKLRLTGEPETKPHSRLPLHEIEKYLKQLENRLEPLQPSKHFPQFSWRIPQVHQPQILTAHFTLEWDGNE